MNRNLNQHRRPFLAGLASLAALGFAASAWSSPIATDNLGLWLKADAITGLNDGDPVATWVDASPVAGNAVQSDPTLQPTFRTNVVNGYPVVRFTNDTMTFANRVGGHVFLVTKGATGSGDGQIFHGNGQFRGWGGTSYLYFDGGYRFSNTTTTYFSWAAREFSFNGGTVSFFDNGGTLGAVSNASILNWNRMGAFAGPSQFYNGDYAEILIYTSQLNSVEQTLVQNYLGAKYALPLDPGADRYTGVGYHRNVFGIGSEADGSVLSRGADGLSFSAVTLDAGDYLLAGHQVETNAWTVGATDTVGGFERWERVWYLDKTGELDATLTFDFIAAGLASPTESKYALIYSPVNAFDFSLLAIGAPIGDQLVFSLANASLLDGYYTIQAIPEPASAALLGLAALAALRRR